MMINRSSAWIMRNLWFDQAHPRQVAWWFRRKNCLWKNIGHCMNPVAKTRGVTDQKKKSTGSKNIKRITTTILAFIPFLPACLPSFLPHLLYLLSSSLPRFLDLIIYFVFVCLFVPFFVSLVVYFRIFNSSLLHLLVSLLLHFSVPSLELYSNKRNRQYWCLTPLISCGRFCWYFFYLWCPLKNWEGLEIRWFFGIPMVSFKSAGRSRSILPRSPCPDLKPSWNWPT